MGAYRCSVSESLERLKAPQNVVSFEQQASLFKSAAPKHQLQKSPFTMAQLRHPCAALILRTEINNTILG